jgi:hypothetical protein
MRAERVQHPPRPARLTLSIQLVVSLTEPIELLSAAAKCGHRRIEHGRTKLPRILLAVAAHPDPGSAGSCGQPPGSLQSLPACGGPGTCRAPSGRHRNLRIRQFGWFLGVGVILGAGFAGWQLGSGGQASAKDDKRDQSCPDDNAADRRDYYRKPSHKASEQEACPLAQLGTR